MITKFNTGSPAPSSGGGSNNSLLYIVMGAVCLYLAYRYIIKPDMDKKKEQT